MKARADIPAGCDQIYLRVVGSGKTTVLISRIVNILRFGRASDSDEVPENASEEDVGLLEAGPSPEARAIAALDPAEPWRVMAITFTNKAADELKERLQRELGAAAGDVWAMTFHSACVRILRRDADRLGFGRNFTIYDASDSQSVMKRIIREMNLDEKLFQYKSVLGEIGRAKDDFISPEEYAARSAGSGDVRRSKYAQLYTEYARRLRSAGAVDFDDLIYFTVKLLKENADVLSYWQNRFRYILIDEYQDTDKLQYMLAEALAGKRRNICVVGDDDQSIYRFRGATIENILSFEDSFRNARVIRLEQNYRSTGHILKAANAVIKNNVGRKGKTLWTDKGDGDLLTLHVAENEREEARYVADRMLEIFGAGEKWKSCAVLYRMNAQSNQLEYAFKRAGIPYRVFGGMRFFDRAEVKDVLAYLCVARNPSDDERLLRIINVPARGVGDTTVETVRRLANERGRVRGPLPRGRKAHGLCRRDGGAARGGGVLPRGRGLRPSARKDGVCPRVGGKGRGRGARAD